MRCGTCKHFKVRRGLFGLCFEPLRMYRGMMRRGHAPYKAAICRGCPDWSARP